MSGTDNSTPTQQNKLYLYMVVQYNGEWEDFKIITDSKKAEEVSIILKRDGTVQEFMANEQGVYSPTYNYYDNGIYVSSDCS